VRAAPNRKMAADGWVSPWRRGGGDSDGRKCTREGRGGSVASVDERRFAWPCAEEIGGEKRRGERGDIERLFEAEAVRQRRGGLARCRMEGGNKKGSGGLGRSVGQCGNGRQRPSRGVRGRRGVATSCCRPNRGGEKGLTGGPWTQCWVAAPADRRARVAQCRAARNQIELKNSSNRFKFAQTLTDPKGVFRCSKNWK
jgi:hypothetical protein